MSKYERKIAELEKQIAKLKEQKKQEEALNDPKIQKLINENSPVGYWKVTTEADEEGRSVKNLGLFYGHIVDIAMTLVDKSFYALHFEELENINVVKPTEDVRSVNIQLDIKTGTWDLNMQDRAEVIKHFLEKEEPKHVKNYNITTTSNYASARIIANGN